MNALTVFNFEEFQVRTQIDIDGNPSWVAKDVCRCLGIRHHRDAASRLDPDERASVLLDGSITVNESGLYSLIFKSSKPEAKRFRKWVTSEVLPTLRKNGTYTIGGKTWQVTRGEGKIARRMLTDIMKVFVEYAKGQGSQSAEFYYRNFSKMVNGALIEIEGSKPKNLRDELNVLQLQKLSVAEQVIAQSLAECMAKALPYKEIYQIAKNKINIYAQSVGKTLLGASERQCLGLTEGAAV